MPGFLKKPIVVVILGFLLLAVVIWIGGEYFGLADETRVILFALLVAAYAVFAIVKGILNQLAGKKLAAAVVNQGQSGPSADVTQLRERFEEATAALKQKKGGSQSLYDVPWYVIIGAPGSGKTTALVNSGLKFPLEQRTGKGALRGVGGTRNCDWWFSEEAVFLDTAGRYTTQDSDAAADSAGWAEFLALLKKYRTRRPLNGVILAISAQDLMVQGQAGRESHVASARRRLNELNKELKINLPVYVLVTKCDLIAGFTEYFDDVTKEGRAQVWGVTFPQQLTDNGGAATAYPEEFDALIQRLNDRVFARLEDDRDVRRRTRVFGFPQQMAALRESLVAFVGDVFETTSFDKRVLLRGVYFTSGTQEGTPIDRLLGAISRRFAVAPEAAPAAARGRAYFIESLLKDVMLAESGLAGVNRRLELRKAAAQLGLYAAMIAIAVLGVLALTISYRGNRSYLAELATKVETLNTVRQNTPAASGSQGVIARLNAIGDVVDVVDRHRADTSWMMRWGLYQGGVGDEARDAYGRELSSLLLPQVISGFERQLNDPRVVEPEAIYAYLKGYLMLGQKGPFDAEFLRGLEWSTSEDAAAAARHFDNLLADHDRIQKVPDCDPAAKRPPCIDPRLVATARAALKDVSMPRLMLMRLHSAYASDKARALVLTDAIRGADQTLRFKSGRPFSDPLPSLFTEPVFREVTSPAAIAGFAAKILSETWVWGDANAPAGNAATLPVEYRKAYENEYIDHWDRVLKDLDVVTMPTVDKMAAALASLASKTSPLRAFFRLVDAQTFLVKPAATGQPSLADRLGQAANNTYGRIVGTSAPPEAPAGTLVTQHFQDIHQLVTGDNALIDSFIKGIQDLQQKLGGIGPGLGGQPPVQVLTQPALAESLRALRQDAANLPAPLPAVAAHIGSQAEGAAIANASTDLESRYKQEVVDRCMAVASDAYPLVQNSPKDVTLVDFGELFGYGGVYDRFFAERLASLVDDSKPTWTARRGDSGGAVVPDQMLSQFRRAREVRNGFFKPGSRSPEFNFTLMSGDPGPGVERLLFVSDGQTFEYRNGPEKQQQMKWPGPSPGQVLVTLEDRSPVPPSIAKTGPWALFRLLDNSTFNTDGEGQYVFRLAAGSRFTYVKIRPDSVLNPLNRPESRRFRCQ